MPFDGLLWVLAGTELAPIARDASSGHVVYGIRETGSWWSLDLPVEAGTISEYDLKFCPHGMETSSACDAARFDRFGNPGFMWEIENVMAEEPASGELLGFSAYDWEPNTDFWCGDFLPDWDGDACQSILAQQYDKWGIGLLAYQLDEYGFHGSHYKLWSKIDSDGANLTTVVLMPDFCPPMLLVDPVAPCDPAGNARPRIRCFYVQAMNLAGDASPVVEYCVDVTSIEVDAGENHTTGTPPESDDCEGSCAVAGHHDGPAMAWALVLLGTILMLNRGFRRQPGPARKSYLGRWFLLLVAGFWLVGISCSETDCKTVQTGAGDIGVAMQDCQWRSRGDADRAGADDLGPDSMERADMGCIWDETPKCAPKCDTMVAVPAGSFWMGCNQAKDQSCALSEFPFHQVFLDDYEIDRTEVTQAAYNKCILAGICDASYLTPGRGWDPVNRGMYPVTVGWEAAKTYCAWVGKRLPTEAEWEKAARGEDGRVYPWGNTDPSTCWVVTGEGGPRGEGGPSPVCSKSPLGDSPYGLCDMAGNVEEWVADWYLEDYYAASPSDDPTGPEAGEGRVLRGGAFPKMHLYYLRTSSRRSALAAYSTTGLRCARSGQR
jgi:formylglycine-generating enzyme required for sulfatase activity